MFVAQRDGRVLNDEVASGTVGRDLLGPFVVLSHIAGAMDQDVCGHQAPPGPFITTVLTVQLITIRIVAACFLTPRGQRFKTSRAHKDRSCVGRVTVRSSGLATVRHKFVVNARSGVFPSP